MLFTVDALYRHYYRRFVKEFDRLKRLTHTATLSVRFDQVAVMKLIKEIDELEKELKKRGINGAG